MNMSASITRQIAGVEALLAVLDGRSKRPNPAQIAMLMADAKEGLATLRKIAARPDLLDSKDRIT